jgi:TonB family protein
MKKLLAFPFIILIMQGFSIFAQKELADNAESNEWTKTEASKESISTFNFTDTYGINNFNIKKAKILAETIVQTTPDGSGQSVVILPRGTIVEMYKYFPKEAVWAIKYNESWGFVKATKVMPVKEKVVEADQEAYDEAPKILSEIKIDYPSEAKRNDIYGKVIVKALISKTGSVEETEIVKSIPGLDEAAIDAVKNTKFKPGKYQGKPVQVWVRIPINFELGTF